MRTIIAVVTPADNVDAEVNVQLTADDNRVSAPVFRLAHPSRVSESQTQVALIKAASESYHVGACLGDRLVYQSPSNTVMIYEIDFDRLSLEENTALKYIRL